MSVREIFAQRFSLLRIKHELSYSDMAKLLGLKNKVSVHHWEKSQKGFPNEENLVEIADLFSVTVDWLLGRTDEMDSSGILEKAEEKVFPPKLIIDEKEYMIPIEFPQQYCVLAVRKEKYSEEERRRIVFILNVIKKKMGNYWQANTEKFTELQVGNKLEKLMYYAMFDDVVNYLQKLDDLLIRE